MNRPWDYQGSQPQDSRHFWGRNLGDHRAPLFHAPSLARCPTAAFPVGQTALSWQLESLGRARLVTLPLGEALWGYYTPWTKPHISAAPTRAAWPKGLPGGLHPACSPCCPRVHLTHSSVLRTQWPSEETGPVVCLQPSCPLCPVATDSKGRLNGRGCLGLHSGCPEPLPTTPHT